MNLFRESCLMKKGETKIYDLAECKKNIDAQHKTNGNSSS